jgi:hypothetical protein
MHARGVCRTAVFGLITALVLLGAGGIAAPPVWATTACLTPTQAFANGPTSLEHCARSGGGGSFLSNEIAYRVTLLRDVFGLSIPAGHLHVPVMSVFDPDNLFEITDATFEERRDTIVQQARALVHAVAATLFD